MPSYFFWGCIESRPGSAIKANIDKQNYTVCPRYWYVDAKFKCGICEKEFWWTAKEQKVWFEEYGFYVDSLAMNCLECRKNQRLQKKLRQAYDSGIETALESSDIQLKKDMAETIDQLIAMNPELPEKIIERRKVLARQIGTQ